MPARKKKQDQERHLYGVHTVSYKSEEIKQRVEKGDIYRSNEIKSRCVYFGDDEQEAAMYFYQVAESAMNNPLARSISMTRDAKQIIYLQAHIAHFRPE